MSRPRLLALDLDGTLLRDDKTVAPEDRAAIAAAMAGGLTVTLATGRLTSSALAYAQELGLGEPLVCADGAVVFCPNRREPLDQEALAPAVIEAALGCARGLGLAPFLFTHGAVLGGAADVQRFPWVSGWTPHVRAGADLEQAAEQGDEPPVTMIAVGGAGPTREAEAALGADARVQADLFRFPIGLEGAWVVRLAPRGCSKAVGLARLARRLGVGQDEVAAVGDWYNDLAMLGWARWSFAMGQAPDDVKRAARFTLRATAAAGGGIAEALAYLADI
jgi:hydroxymethylpyrimidine pyrophosphatase-like HAD family hydrolase